MPIPSLPRVLRRLTLPALLLTTAPAALAQYPTGATVQSLPQAGDPAELLATALRTLAVEPSNLAALTAAGHNALVLGDPNAAVGFFGRAQEIAPRDGRVKAGLGSALVELEKPQDALRLFADASRLGVPEADIAEDRGLAYDLTGDPKRAQRDYAIVLAAHPEDDVARRRLALSQGISGDKAAAIATLDPLIRKRDIAGWRAQTFVLAMDGDTKGASDITHIMLPQQADMLQPFLVRLSSLSAADKARAVNFGEMPAAGRAYTPTELANTGAAPTYAASTNAARAAPASAPRVAGTHKRSGAAARADPTRDGHDGSASRRRGVACDQGRVLGCDGHTGPNLSIRAVGRHRADPRDADAAGRDADRADAHADTDIGAGRGPADTTGRHPPRPSRSRRRRRHRVGRPHPTCRRRPRSVITIYPATMSRDPFGPFGRALGRGRSAGEGRSERRWFTARLPRRRLPPPWRPKPKPARIRVASADDQPAVHPTSTHKLPSDDVTGRGRAGQAGQDQIATTAN